VSQQKLNNGVIRYLKPEEEKRLRAVLLKAVDACGAQNERRKKRLMHRIYELDIALGTGMRKTSNMASPGATSISNFESSPCAIRRMDQAELCR
jgi:hypothetical protein